MRINWKYPSDFSLKNGIFFYKSKKNTRVARNVLKVWKKEENNSEAKKGQGKTSNSRGDRSK